MPMMSGLMLGLRRREMARRLPAVREFSELGDFLGQTDRDLFPPVWSSVLRFRSQSRSEPDVLLIDEVLAVGDAEFSERSGAALRDACTKDEPSCS